MTITIIITITMIVRSNPEVPWASKPTNAHIYSGLWTQRPYLPYTQMPRVKAYCIHSWYGMPRSPVLMTRNPMNFKVLTELCANCLACKCPKVSPSLIVACSYPTRFSHSTRFLRLVQSLLEAYWGLRPQKLRIISHRHLVFAGARVASSRAPGASTTITTMAVQPTTPFPPVLPFKIPQIPSNYLTETIMTASIKRYARCCGVAGGPQDTHVYICIYAYTHVSSIHDIQHIHIMCTYQSLSTTMYIYIYTYTCVYMYIYIFMRR